MPHQYVSRDFPTTRRSGFRPPLPYVVRNGRYHYFRRPGLSRTRLPGLPFWPEYMAAYNAAYQQAFPDRVTPTPCTPPPPTQQPSSPTARRISYVYIIGESRDGPVKIGVSTNPKARLSELQTGTPVKLKVLAKFRGDEEQEAFAHRLLGAHRINGEWFARTPAVNAFIDNVRRGVSVAGMVIDPALEPLPPRKQSNAQPLAPGYLWNGTTQELIPILPEDHPDYRDNVETIRAAFRRWERGTSK